MALERIGGAWKRESKKGVKMLSLSLDIEPLKELIEAQEEDDEERVRLLLMKNSYKDSPKHPDLNAFVVTDEEEDDDDDDDDEDEDERDPWDEDDDDDEDEEEEKPKRKKKSKKSKGSKRSREGTKKRKGRKRGRK